MNNPEQVYRYQTHLDPLVKVRYSRTTSNSCDREMHTLLSLHWSGSKRFEEVRCGIKVVGEGSRKFAAVEPPRTSV